MAEQEWVTITEAAIRLNVATSKISRLVKDRKLQTIENPVDKRAKLVDFTELQKLFKYAK